MNGGRPSRIGEFTPLTPATVYLDIVAPGHATVTGPGFSGTVTADPTMLSGPRRYKVELTASDHIPTGPHGRVAHYEAGARRLATAHGLIGKSVLIERNKHIQAEKDHW